MPLSKINIAAPKKARPIAPLEIFNYLMLRIKIKNVWVPRSILSNRKNTIVIANETHRNLNIDLAIKETSRSKVKMTVKHFLKKHEYPPGLQEKTTQLVLEQAEELCKKWM